jgi:hypothetical protein
MDFYRMSNSAALYALIILATSFCAGAVLLYAGYRAAAILVG